MTIKVIDWSYYTGTVPGYGDCRAVVGEYACLLPDRHVESFLGIAALPGENINYLRIPRAKGDGRMAGGGQTTKPDPTYEWQWPNGWVKRGLMWGPNAVIYDALSRYVQTADRAEYQRTAGWRFADVNNRLYDCASTRENVARGIYEWTDFGDIAIGQGADGIAVVSFPGEPLRRLDPRPPRADGKPLPESDARFIRSDREGDQFGIAIVELKGRKTYFVWPTLDELRALPFVTDAPPIEPPIEPPTNPPIPPVEPPVNQAPDRQDVVSAVMAAHPNIDTNNEEARAAIPDWSAQRLNAEEGGVRWGRKSRGKPVNGMAVNPNTDGLTLLRDDGRFEIIDVINGNGGTAMWHNFGPFAQGENGWWAPPQMGPELARPGEPPVEPPSGDLEARVAAIEADIAALRSAMKGWVR